MQNILNKIPRSFWTCLGVSLLPISFGIGYVLSQSSGVKYSNNDGGTSITIDTAKKIKKASNDTEYANKKLAQEIEQALATLEFFLNSNTTPDPVLQTVKDDIEKLQPVVNEIDRSNEELKEAVEKVEEEE